MRKTIFMLSAGLLLSACGPESVKDARQETSQPSIYPDYTGVTIPVNIAPLNFVMQEEDALLVDAVISDSKGHQLHGQGKESINLDIDDWHELMAQNVGDSLSVTVSAKYEDGWHTYQPFCLYVSSDSIDYGLCYRLIEPGYEVWSKMGIYERDLSTFDERPLIENTQFKGCVNCHSFNRGDSKNLSLHIRGEHGATLIRTDNGPLTAYNTKTPETLGLCVYPYWHPAGRYIAYSTNTTRQSFHLCDKNRIEVFDFASDIQVYDTEHNVLITSPIVKQDSIFETFPVFSADGKTLYFCSAHHLPADKAQNIDSIYYDLSSIAFDADQGRIGDSVALVLDAASIIEGKQKSISFPRPSYDGRFLVYTLSDYGQFSIWHPESDLWLLDLQTGENRQLTRANSDNVDSFHNWSSNSRWLVISSRRDDGLFTRPYFCHIDESGHESKAFMLPQQKPRRYYRDLFMSYNVPDFVTSPVSFDAVQATDAINSKTRKDFVCK